MWVYGLTVMFWGTGVLIRVSASSSGVQVTMLSYLDGVTAPANPNPASPPFDLLVSSLFQKLATVSSSNVDTSRYPNLTAYRQHIFESFISHWKIQIGPDISLALALICPNRSSRSYFLKDVKLNHLIINILNIPKDSDHYNQLYNWKKNFHNRRATLVDPTADLPLLISHILSVRRAGASIKPSVTIAEVNQALDRLTEVTKTDEQRQVLVPLLDRLTIEEIRWLFQIILKDSILSTSETQFFRCWHPDAPGLFNICKDLNKVFWCLCDPSKRLSREQLLPQLFYSFNPQASHKLTIPYTKFCKKMIAPLTTPNKKLQDVFNRDGFKDHFIVEEKLDGDRMVVHMVNESYPDSYLKLTFKFYNRRRRDYTRLYGGTNSYGPLTSYLTNAFNGDPNTMVKNIILDGEMLAWDTELKAILPFGILRHSNIQESVKQFTASDPFKPHNSQPLFIAFDVVHLNDNDLTQVPLFYRKALLSRIINPVPARFEVLKYNLISTPDDIKLAMRNVVATRSEGVMAKGCLSKYHVGVRSTTWIKIKPEYLEHFGENLDVVIIGMIPGVKNSYMCGLVDLNENQVVKSFCTVANGFTNDEYSQIATITQGKWRDLKKTPPPKNLLQFGTKKPDFWIDPANSLVLEIKARSIDNISETTYAAGSTLHNLWCRSIRTDKDYTTSETLQAYVMKKQNLGYQLEQDQAVNRKRRLTVDASFEEKHREKSVKKESELFKNIVFTVLTDYKNEITNERITIKKIREEIKKCGGMLTNDAKSVDTNRYIAIVLSQRMSPTSQLYLQQGFDIISPRWMFESKEKNQIAPIEPAFIVGTNNDNLLTLAEKNIDEYGDSFTCEIDPKFGIEKYFLLLNFRHRLKPLSLQASITEFMQECNTPLVYLFQGINFYIVTIAEGRSWDHERVKHKISMFLGSVVDSVQNCSYVIVPYGVDQWRESMVAAVDQVSSAISERIGFTSDTMDLIPSIVRESFLDQCIEHGEIGDAKDHKVR